MDFRLEGVALDILVEKSAGRDFTAGKKLNKNSSPHTYDLRMCPGLSGGRIQTSDISQIPHVFATKYFSVDPIPTTHLCTRPSIYTRPNEESHDGNGTCTKEEEKGIYTEGIAQIPDDNNNPTIRYEGARLEQQ